MQSVTMTSLKQTSLFTEEQLTSSQEAFPASHTHQQVSDSEKKMSAICGRKCLEQYEKFNHVGLWAKTFSALLIGMEGWSSKRCKLIWKLKGTKSNRMYFQLRPLALHTEEIGSSLLPTPRAQEPGKTSEGYGACLTDVIQGKKMQHLLPTPQAMDSITNTPRQITESGRIISNQGHNGSAPLKDLAMNGMLPTPVKSDCTPARPSKNWQGSDLGGFINRGNTGKIFQLNPQFVMEMMGFPTDWTELPFLNGETNQSKQEETQ
jgi:hypothetical protein